MKKVLFASVLGMMLAVNVAFAAPDPKVLVCHVTGSETNDYNLIEVSSNALDGQLGTGSYVLPEDVIDCEGTPVPDPL